MKMNERRPQNEKSFNPAAAVRPLSSATFGLIGALIVNRFGNRGKQEKEEAKDDKG